MRWTNNLAAAGLALAGVTVMVGGASAQQAGATPAAAPATGGYLDIARFKTISNADLDKLSTSGCSFSVIRGKDLIAFMDTQEDGNDKPGYKPAFWIKLDGKMTKVSGTGKKANQNLYLGTWSGTVGGQPLTIIEGKKNPKFKNDGGGEGGEAKLKFNGPTGPVEQSFKWEAGC